MFFTSKNTIMLFVIFLIILSFVALIILQNIKLNFFVESLTLEEKLGQLLMIAPASTDFDKELLNLIKNYHIGNIKIFGKNYKNKEELLNLIVNCQNSSLRYNKGIPMFIATDQEGGWIAHLKKNFTIPPSNMAIGKTKNSIYAYIAGALISSELSKIGVNVNFAPVLDLDLNKDNWVIGPRAYSSDPQIVINMASEFIRASLKYNVMPVIKHYPGHGSLKQDSHNYLITNNQSYDKLSKTELLPFLYFIRNFKLGLMAGHIAAPGIVKYIENLEKKEYKNYYFKPATVSKVLIKDYLIKHNKARVLIFSDEISMKSITSIMSLNEAVCEAIKSGVNVVVINQDYKNILSLINYLKNKYITDKEFQKDVDNSVKRIIMAKANLFLPLNKRDLFSIKIFNIKKFKPDYKKISEINNELNRKIAYQLSVVTTDIVKDKKNLIPLIKNKSIIKNKFVIISTLPELYYGVKKWLSNAVYLNPKYLNLKWIPENDNSIIIFGLKDKKELKLLNQIYRKNQNIIVINFLHNSNIENLDYIDTIISIYSDKAVQIYAGVDVLFSGKKDYPELLEYYSIF